MGLVNVLRPALAAADENESIAIETVSPAQGR
jgi:hypothetical protein